MSEDMKPVLGETAIEVENSDEALARTIEQVLGRGHTVSTFAVGDESNVQTSREIIAYQVVVKDPRDRILINPARPLHVVGAVARFVWMFAGSDRLDDIAFYEPKVQTYTDNQISVPGSNYGMRLFQPRPGLNQIQGVIDAIRRESGSRRSAAVIWNPEDAVRASRDIPCAFGSFYHVRDGRLIATTVMRSNNAHRLLPFNMFEFGLIAEMVATTVDVELGAYIHFAASMHVLSSEMQAAEAVVRNYHDNVLGKARTPMPAMPAHKPPLEQALSLARLESAMRHDMKRLTIASVAQLKDWGTDLLEDYWLGFYRVLLAHALAKVERFHEAQLIAAELPDYFRDSVLKHVHRLGTHGLAEGTQLKFGLASEGLDDLVSAFTPSLTEERAAVDGLYSLCKELEEKTATVVSLDEFHSLRRALIVESPTSLAARSEGATQGPDDRRKIALEEVKEALRRIRVQRG